MTACLVIPITVNPPIPIVIAVAVMMPVRLEHALDCAHGTADAGANRASDHPADGACDPVAFGRALLGAADDALGVADMGHGDERQRQGEKRNMNGSSQPAGRAAVLTLVLFISIP
jgi:hypothetical protein